MDKQHRQQGQIVIIALLVMVVVLAIALSIVGRSITEISTSTRTEESSRAFSAAEAGIERAFSAGATTGTSTISLSNLAQAGVEWDAGLPKQGQNGQPGWALEYPPFGKESFAQFWLVRPSTLEPHYTQGAFEVYFGDIYQDYTPYQDPLGEAGDLISNKPGLEINVIVCRRVGSSPCTYESKRYFVDSDTTGTVEGRPARDFLPCLQIDSLQTGAIKIPTNNYPANRPFYCKVKIPSDSSPDPYLSGSPGSNDYPVMLRVRMLFSSTSHPLAIQPLGSNASLPPQAKVYKSTGTVGNVQRVIEVFQQQAVMPQLFDYALFSVLDVTKTND